jgi:hypothetical protein
VFEEWRLFGAKGQFLGEIEPWHEAVLTAIDQTRDTNKGGKIPCA